MYTDKKVNRKEQTKYKADLKKNNEVPIMINVTCDVILSGDILIKIIHNGLLFFFFKKKKINKKVNIKCKKFAVFLLILALFQERSLNLKAFLNYSSEISAFCLFK